MAPPLCNKIHEKIFIQFIGNISPHKIAENLDLAKSKVHNIVKTFREFGDILVYRDHWKYRQVLWSQGHLRWIKRRCAVVRWVHISACFGEDWVSSSLCQWWKRPSRLSANGAKADSSDGMWGHLSPRHGWGGCVCVWRYHWCRPLACCLSRSASYWKCKSDHEEENQKTATADCWAASFESSKNGQKFQLRNWHNQYAHFENVNVLFLYLPNTITLVTKTLLLFFVLLSVK